MERLGTQLRVVVGKRFVGGARSDRGQGRAQGVAGGEGAAAEVLAPYDWGANGAWLWEWGAPKISKRLWGPVGVGCGVVRPPRTSGRPGIARELLVIYPTEGSLAPPPSPTW